MPMQLVAEDLLHMSLSDAQACMMRTQNTWAEVLVVPLSGCAAGGESDRKQVPLRQGYKLRPPAPTPSCRLGITFMDSSYWRHFIARPWPTCLDHQQTNELIRELTKGSLKGYRCR